METVWVTDDDTDDHYLIEHALKQIAPALAIKQLYDGDELLESLYQTATLPKLVLLDLNMQRKDGFQTLEALRSISNYEEVPVIIFTTSDEKEDRLKSLALGANDFLTKPRTFDKTVAMLAKLCQDWKLV